MTIDTKAAQEASEVADTVPYCVTCGNWAGIFVPGRSWQHSRSNPAPNGTQAPFDAGHAVELGWWFPPVPLPLARPA